MMGVFSVHGCFSSIMVSFYRISATKIQKAEV